SGVVKLTSGDPTWRDLTALSFHYETQPLPTPVSWYVAQLPLWWHRTSAAAMFAVELGAPCLIALGAQPRRIAAALLIALQLGIAVTGNYGYFNLLSIALCVLLLDDRVFSRRVSAAPALRQRWRPWLAGALALATVPISSSIFASQLGLPVPSLLYS